MRQARVFSVVILMTIISAQGVLAFDDDIPVIIQRGNKPSLPVVIYFTGDGGWNDFSQQLAEVIHKRGYTIFSIDTKKYFWIKKTPEEVALMVSGLLRSYPKDFKGNNVVLMGYSFGASVIPFVINRLPINDQEAIKTVFCLSPSIYADFEVKVATMLNISADDKHYPVIAELNKLKKQRINVFFGKDENKRDIRAFKESGLRLTLFPGSHGYNKDSSAVGDEIDLITREVK